MGGEIERRWPGSLRLFAPSETTAARSQLGARRFKTDDRDCAALVWLLRQGAGRPAEPDTVAALLGAVRHRRQLVDARRSLQQRLHDQLNALCPGLSAPPGHGRALKLESPTGQAVLGLRGRVRRPPAEHAFAAGPRPGPLTAATAAFWAERWRRLLDPPADAELRAERLGGDLRRWQDLHDDIALDRAPARAAARRHRRPDPDHAARRRRPSGPPSSAPTRLPIERWPTPEHLYSATGLAPATYQSSTITRRGRISRQGLPEHRNALMGIAWGLSQQRAGFRARDAELRARGFRPDPGPRRAGPPRLPALLAPASQPTALRRSALRSRQAARAVTALISYAARRRNLACRPPAQPPLTAHTKACRTTAPDQPADPTAAARTTHHADPRKHRDHPPRRSPHGHHRP